MNDAYHYTPFSKGSDVKTYIFAVSLEPDEEGWRAFYPPLEHVGASTWGETEDEALKHIQEVLSMIVEEFADEGKDIPSSQGLLVTGGAAVAVTK
jgi:predicted RNase H-like HicB family nuclease